MQVCTLLQTDNHASNPPLSFLQAGCHSCHPTNSVKALKGCDLAVKEWKKCYLGWNGGSEIYHYRHQQQICKPIFYHFLSVKRLCQFNQLHCSDVCSFILSLSVRFHLSTMCLLLCTLVFSLSFCAFFCSLFCQSVVLWATLPESSTWINEWTMSKIQLIHVTVIKYNALRSNTHSKIHKNGNTAQNVITHTLC